MNLAQGTAQLPMELTQMSNASVVSRYLQDASLSQDLSPSHHSFVSCNVTESSRLFSVGGCALPNTRARVWTSDHDKVP